jgi:hypothetical protein
MRAILNFMVLFVATVAAAVPSARAETAPIQAFYGTFEGRTLFPMGEPSNRELSVRVERAGRFGFVVEWQTTIAKANHKPVRRIDVLEFEPTLRANVYAAVPRRGVESSTPQGARPRATGPVDGEPYAWARIAGRTLTVNVLTIEDSGDYVIQIYERTLTDTGMTLEFTRLRNGHVEQQIKGNLNRVGG